MPSPSLDNRFLALRYVGRESKEFSLTDDEVRRFMALRDEGADDAAIGAEMHLDPEFLADLVSADKAYEVSHRIATGEESMYPAPGPGDQMVDTRSGSLMVPGIVLAIVLVVVGLVALLR